MRTGRSRFTGRALLVLPEPFLLNQQCQKCLQFGRSEYWRKLRTQTVPSIASASVIPNPIHISGVIPFDGNIGVELYLLNKYFCSPSETATSSSVIPRVNGTPVSLLRMVMNLPIPVTSL